LRAHQEEFEKRGVGIAAIGLGDMNYARVFREDTGITFPLLVDDERKAYKAAELHKANIFHLLRRDNAASRKRAKAGGFEQKKLGKDPFQLGATFVFAPGDQDWFVHQSETFGDNASVERVLAAIDQHRRV
jgi:peroxiredoxin